MRNLHTLVVVVVPLVSAGFRGMFHGVIDKNKAGQDSQQAPPPYAMATQEDSYTENMEENFIEETAKAQYEDKKEAAERKTKHGTQSIAAVSFRTKLGSAAPFPSEHEASSSGDTRVMTSNNWQKGASNAKQNSDVYTELRGDIGTMGVYGLGKVIAPLI